MSHSTKRAIAPLRVCLIDMNNGQPNQGIRCLRRILDAFFVPVRKANPGIEIEVVDVEPRTNAAAYPVDCDLYLSSGGPGSPFDGETEEWYRGFGRLVDGLIEEGHALPAPRSMFAICHSFELCVVHTKVARLAQRPNRKFGIMPVYMTEAGMASPLLADFGERLFAFEHRTWEVVDVDQARLASFGGEVWARESRDGASKGRSISSFRFCPNIEGTLFHPEADREGAVKWLDDPAHVKDVIEAYGELTYKRMVRTMDDPMRLARTFAVLLPGWLSRRFNARALLTGWQPVQAPQYDVRMRESFGTPADRMSAPTEEQELELA